jgi:uncharacterized protein involved in type VI secretion and phage assembly
MSTLLRAVAPPMLGAGAFLATVVSVQDPENRNRVQIRVYDVDGAAGQDATPWARVAVPVAGGKRGAFFIPGVGDEVLVVYLAGDPRFPVVVGGLWNGNDAAPETLGGAGDKVDRWSFTGTAGTRVAIVEDSSGPTISLTTPGGLSGVMTDSQGSITFSNAQGTTITIDASGVTISAPTGQLSVTAASSISLTAPQLTVNAASSTFSGIVTCPTIIATSVVGTSYTPGAGNVW